MRRIIAVLTGVLVSAAGLVGLVPPPAGASGPAATMRQLAGAIPSPFYDADTVGAIAKTSDSLFVIDLHGIVRVDLETKHISVFAGDPLVPGSTDGPALSARFFAPNGLSTDGVNLYVLDGGNVTIRRIVIATGRVTTLAGMAGASGYADGTGAAARFALMGGLTLDSAGENLYVTDQCTLRKIVVVTRLVTTLAGVAGQCGQVDGIGPAARLGGGAITEDADALWIAESLCIRKIVTSSALVTTLACPGDPQYYLGGITTIGTDVFVVKVTDNGEDPITNLIRVQKGTGAISLTAEPPYPFFSRHLVRDGSRFWVSGHFSAQPIFTVDPGTGTVANPFGFGQEGTLDGAGPNARLTTGPLGGMSTDGVNLYVSDETNGRIRKVVTATGVTSTLATGMPSPKDSTVVGGALFVASENTVKKVVIATGQVSTVATVGTSSRDVNDISSDGTNLYVTSDDCALYRVVIVTGAVTVLAGSPGQCGYVDGVGTSARFGLCCFQHGPKGITIEGGSLYVADKAQNAIRKVVIATASVTTVLRHGSGSTRSPLDVVTDGTDLYMSDQSRIYRVPIATGLPEPITGSYPSITYQPALASATRAYLGAFENSLALGADGHHLYFTNRTGVGVITDAKLPPQLGIGNVSITEGDRGTGLAVFTVRLSSPQPNLVSVDFFTNEGTATAASGDYVSQSGRLDFAPGVVEKRIKVTVNGDTVAEVSETFTVQLASPSGGTTLGRTLGKAKILDDDPSWGGVTLALGDVKIVEGDDHGARAVFPVRLSAAQPDPVIVNFGTGDGTATARDYDPRLGTLTFPAGVTSKNVFVKVNGDYDREALETFTLTIAGSSGPTITRATGTARIINDD